MAKKVGEHITLDIIGTKKEYTPSFFEKLVYKIRNRELYNGKKGRRAYNSRYNRN